MSPSEAAVNASPVSARYGARVALPRRFRHERHGKATERPPFQPLVALSRAALTNTLNERPQLRLKWTTSVVGPLNVAFP